MPICGPKMSPRISSIAQIIFSFRSFEISEGILRIQKFIIGEDSFPNLCFVYLTLFGQKSLYRLYPVERCKITVFLFGSILPNLKGH